MIGLTNRMELLDSALIRDGRLEHHIHIGYPDIIGRSEIYQIHLKKPQQTNKIEKIHNDTFKLLAELSEGFSGANIMSVCREFCMEHIINPKIIVEDTLLKKIEEKKKQIIYDQRDSVIL